MGIHPLVPRQSIMFAGHLVDAPERTPPRFPERMTGAAAQRIAQELEALQADGSDLGLTQGAAGGDILFAECALARGMPLQLLQPFDEPRFLRESVACRGDDWVRRYHGIRAQLDPARPVLAPPRVLGPLRGGEDPYERCNRWLSDTALAQGPARMTLIVLWDGSGGDGPGGTAHMVGHVRQQGGRVVWIDTRTL